jgi:hypothetical protein
VNLTFNYIKTDVKETFIPKKYDPKYIIQGSYFCNSKNGAGELASNVTPLRCKNGDGKFQTPDTKNLGNYIAIYEIKYNKQYIECPRCKLRLDLDEFWDNNYEKYSKEADLSNE